MFKRRHCSSRYHCCHVILIHAADLAVCIFESDPSLLSVYTHVRPEMTLWLNWLNHLSAQGSAGRHPPLSNSPCRSVNSSLLSAGPISLQLLNGASPVIFGFPFLPYDCWSSDAGLVFCHWVNVRLLKSTFIGSCCAFPPWIVKQLYWMTSHGGLERSASLNAVLSLCLMITFPVCFSLKASRQILICFANLLSLSWLLYLLCSVLTLC